MDAVIASPAGPANYNGFSFGKLSALASIGERVDQIILSGKISSKETLFAFKDGTGAVFDEEKQKLEDLNLAEPVQQGLRRIIFPSGVVWRLSDEFISLSVPSAQPASGTAGKVFKASGDFKDLDLLSASLNMLILHKAGNLKLIHFRDDSFEIEDISKTETWAQFCLLRLQPDSPLMQSDYGLPRTKRFSFERKISGFPMNQQKPSWS